MIFPRDRLGTVTDHQTQESWSGPEIGVAAGERARALTDAGIGPGDCVLLWQAGSGPFFADLLAVWAAGAAAAVLNPGLTPEELGRIAAHVGPKAALVAGNAAVARGLLALPVFDFGADIVPAGAGEAPSRPGGLDDPALILFTSGTTGTPKGVVQSFRSLAARLALNAAFIGAADMKTALCTLPVHFGHGLIGNSLTPWLHGGDVVLMPGSDMRALGQLGAVIDRHAVSFMSSVPAFWKLALKLAKPPTGGSLKRVHVGSAPLSADLWSRIVDWSGTRNVVNMYGITETANWIGGASAAEFEPQDGLVGRVWGGRAGVRDAGGEIASEGEGEIWVHTPSLMTGYFHQDELTAETLQDGWFRTGDIGRIEDGVLRLTGREKHEINRAGLKVHPEDIDILLERHEGVVEACAFGAPDAIAGETVCVAVVLEPGLDLDDLKTWCAERLVREKNPEKWFVVDAIPKTDRGKIQRAEVARVCLGSGE